MWALLIFIISVPGNNIPAIDTHLTFATVQDCHVAAADVRDAMNNKGSGGLVRCVRLRAGLAQDPINP